MNRYEAVIGLEVHAQLKTKSKMFCACATNFGDAPNRNICPVCTGQPGTLPVVNRLAVEMAVKAGLALRCTIHGRSVFARKNYFYPDLPKGYQISQYEYPLCTKGYIDIKTGSSHRRIGITRVHLEEDAGKLMHAAAHPDKSLVDFNRCGVPLIEIVSEPDMRSTAEAGDYLRTLRNALVYLGVCDGNLEQGNFRCDANISIRPVGQSKLGTRTEMKNLNSFKAVERAIAYEIGRQSKVLDGGGTVVQETRLWDDVRGATEALRGKEEAHDYRYFPDPDLLPLEVDVRWIEGVQSTLPELAGERSKRFIEKYGLPEYDADVLTQDKKVADYFEDVIKAGAPPKKASNWVMGEILRTLKEKDIGIESAKISPRCLAGLISMVDSGKISVTAAKDVFAEMEISGEPPDAIVERKGLSQVSDAGALDAMVDKVIAGNPAQVGQYKCGKLQLLGFLVGLVMKESKGKANPQLVSELLKKKLGS
jgi:aspartyl-tRNA(Asn)/glutamyl-tRNA(Gln) amidotransferase subunit B